MSGLEDNAGNVDLEKSFVKRPLLLDLKAPPKVTGLGTSENPTGSFNPVIYWEGSKDINGIQKLSVMLLGKFRELFRRRYAKTAFGLNVLVLDPWEGRRHTLPL